MLANCKSETILEGAGRMRRLLMIGTALSLFVLATPAFAAKPDVVVDGAFSGDEIIPAGEICDFDVRLVESGHERITRSSVKKVIS